VEIPETRYAIAADGAYIAYQVFGQGDHDVLYAPGFASHLEVSWEIPPLARFLRRMGSTSRVIWFDKRGTGLSSRTSGAPNVEAMLGDVYAVLVAAESERAVLLGDGPDGGGACAVFAATYPDQTTALVWWEPRARSEWTADYPWGETPEELDEMELLVGRLWGRESDVRELERLLGGMELDPSIDAVIARYFRNSGTPGDAIALQRMWASIDVRAVLPTIQVPTLLLDRAGLESGGESEFVASLIAGSRIVHLEPHDGFPLWLGNIEEGVTAIEGFIEGLLREEAEFDRVLATVLFTDIVASTETASRLGDAAWRDLLQRHHATVRALLARYRGTEVDTAGDGFFATFEGPARAVRCAEAIRDAIRTLGLQIRAGVHTGEVETMDGKVGGVAVAIGARVAAKAGPSEVLVSQTVKDLVAGSGLEFEEAGEYELKGVPDRWHLYRATS
jgi:class 3 adenylate cyclase/pimeloyl-ACP methyl ester carboxylesterase